MMALGILFGLLLVLALIPVGIRGRYDQDGGTVTAFVGPVSIALYPGKPKKDGKKEKKAEKKPKKEKGTAVEKKSGGTVAFFRELVALGLEALGALRRRLYMKELTLYYTVGALGKAPAQWGILYGAAWSAVGNLIPVLENTFRIGSRDVQVYLDDTTVESRLYFSGQTRIFLGELLYLVIKYGHQGLKLYSKRKGSNVHGTSHQ